MIYPLVFALFCVKHFFADFPQQTAAMVKGKAIYGNWDGIAHSGIHAFYTGIIVLFLTGHIGMALTMAGLDFFAHYHIDYIRMNYGNRDIQSPQFWNHLGLDQLAHYLVYCFFVYSVIPYVK